MNPTPDRAAEAAERILDHLAINAGVSFLPRRKDELSALLRPCFADAEARAQAAEARVEKLRTRLRDQTHQTQITAQQKHDEVLAVLQRYGVAPEGIDPQGHPIEQVVGTCLSALMARAQAAEAKLAEVRIQCECYDGAHVDTRDFIAGVLAILDREEP